ncbi:hypothetical protein BC829DRAFT_416072 [Chytridium lagenaria]|nr:hypothetical protein BC829DRAFT_416072 [Chytridium lagenaria]
MSTISWKASIFATADSKLPYRSYVLSVILASLRWTALALVDRDQTKLGAAVRVKLSVRIHCLQALSTTFAHACPPNPLRHEYDNIQHHRDYCTCERLGPLALVFIVFIFRWLKNQKWERGSRARERIDKLFKRPKPQVRDGKDHGREVELQNIQIVISPSTPDESSGTNVPAQPGSTLVALGNIPENRGVPEMPRKSIEHVLPMMEAVSGYMSPHQWRMSVAASVADSVIVKKRHMRGSSSSTGTTLCDTQNRRLRPVVEEGVVEAAGFLGVVVRTWNCTSVKEREWISEVAQGSSRKGCAVATPTANAAGPRKRQAVAHSTNKGLEIFAKPAALAFVSQSNITSECWGHSDEDKGKSRKLRWMA